MIQSLFLLLIGVYSQDPDLVRLTQIVNSGQNSWQASLSHPFVNYNLKKLKSLTGLKNHSKKQFQKSFDQYLQTHENVSLPDNYDARIVWPNCQSLIQVRDQSGCQGCFAFAAAISISDRICIGSNQVKQTRISVQDILDCCGSNCGNCKVGGYQQSPFIYYKNIGICTGWIWNDKYWCKAFDFMPNPIPPKRLPGSCLKSCDLGSSRIYSNDIHKGKQIFKISNMNLSQVMAQIMTRGPVTATYNVYQDFINYKSGVYHYTGGNFVGGHVVKIVGWGVQNNVAYWLVANTWGDKWGINGFFKIRRGTNQCKFEQSFVFAVPDQ